MTPRTLVLRLWRTDPVARFSAVGCFLAVGLAATVLVAFAAVPGALTDRARHLAWRGDPATMLVTADGSDGTLAPRQAPILVDDHRLRLAGRTVDRVDLAAPRSAARPAGLPAIPAAGESLVSPALARALHGPDGGVLRQAIPGRIVGELGPAALAGPGEWVIAAGRPRAALLDTDATGVASLRGSHGIIAQPFLVALCWIALAIVAFPAAALAFQVARLQAARRGGRVAALRLAGAAPGWVLRAAALETTAVAALGAVCGAGGGLWLAHTFAGVRVDGTAWWPAALTPPLWALLAAVLILPALVAGATVAASWRAAAEPFTAVRATPQPVPGHWRLALVPGVLVALLLAVRSLSVGGSSLPLLTVLAAGVVATILVGAWTVHQVGQGFGAVWRGPALLLASRRMRGQSTAVWSVACGPVLAAFAATMVLAMLPLVDVEQPAATHAHFIAVGVPSGRAAEIAAAAGHRSDGLRFRVAGLARSVQLSADADIALPGGQRVVDAVVDTPSEVQRGTAALTAVAAGAQPFGAGQSAGDPQLAGAIGTGAIICLIVTALLAAAATALATAGGILDRARTLGALGLAGVSTRSLGRALRAEVALPTALGTLAAAACGLLLTQALLGLTHDAIPGSAWPGVAAGVAVAIALPWLGTWLARPLLIRHTGLDAVRG